MTAKHGRVTTSGISARSEPEKPFVVSLSNQALAINWKIKSAPVLPRKAWFDKLTTNGIFDKLTTNGIFDKLTTNGIFDRPTTNGIFDKLTTNGFLATLTSKGVNHSYPA